MKKTLYLIAFASIFISAVTPAEASRRPRGPVIIVTSPKPIVSHS